MQRPVLLAVDGDAEGLRNVERELLERYARDYEVVCLGSATEALRRLDELADAGEPVALVLAATALAGGTGTALLAEARLLHAHAKRALLIGWGEWGAAATGDAISEAIAVGQIDHYVVRPFPPPDELFHQAISSFLLEWAEAQRIAPHAIHVVGDSWSGRAYELRSVLESCAFPHTFSLADSAEGTSVLETVNPKRPLPVVVLPDGTALRDPSDAELARAAGSPPSDAESFDLVIVAPGPQASPRPCTAPRRGCGRWSSTEAGSAVRPARAPRFATTSASRAGSAAAASRSRRTSRHGSSGGGSPS